MEMLKEASFNKLNNFVSGYYIDENLCDDMITYFENSKDKQEPGVLYGDSGKFMVDRSRKASTDLSCNIKERSSLITRYVNELRQCIEQYKKQYIYCDNYQEAWAACDLFNIQKYKPSESYSQWHFEKSGPHTIYRHLTFMTYLNTVKKGGETEWFYQKLKIKPEKGLTVIWGTDWTTTHRGIPAPEETKYIATGWVGHIKD